VGSDPAPTTGVASEFGALAPMTRPAAPSAGPAGTTPAHRAPGGVRSNAPASRW
jgi:hypothetical protein